jgi:hypothetical protein
MELVLFRKIVEEIVLHPNTFLRIHATGEPLLWPFLPEALSILRYTGISSWLFTSGATSNRRLLQQICTSVQVIEISVNSVNRAEYRAIKGIDVFDSVVGNIRFMREEIGERTSARLVVSRVESEDHAADSEFIDYWKSSGLVHDAFVRSRHTYNNLLDGLQNAEQDAESSENFRHAPCLVHWARFNISTGGDAVVCFNELFKKEINAGLIYGNLNQLSIESLWKGDKIEAIRAAELSGDYCDSLIDKDLPCKNCNYCQPLFGAEGRQTSEFQIQMYRRSNGTQRTEQSIC